MTVCLSSTKFLFSVLLACSYHSRFCRVSRSAKDLDSSSARWVGDNADSHNCSLALNQYSLDQHYMHLYRGQVKRVPVDQSIGTCCRSSIDSSAPLLVLSSLQ